MLECVRHSECYHQAKYVNFITLTMSNKTASLVFEMPHIQPASRSDQHSSNCFHVSGNNIHKNTYLNVIAAALVSVEIHIVDLELHRHVFCDGDCPYTLRVAVPTPKRWTESISADIAASVIIGIPRGMESTPDAREVISTTCSRDVSQE